MLVWRYMCLCVEVCVLMCGGMCKLCLCVVLCAYVWRCVCLCVEVCVLMCGGTAT